MSLVHRALGITALVNEILGAITFYHIRLNWIVLAVLPGLFVDGAAQLGSPRPTWPSLHPQFLPTLEMTFSASAFALLLICLVRRNTIFRPTTFLGGNGVISRAAVPASSQDIDLRVTGRFDRGGGNSLSIRDFPARWHLSETGAISMILSVRNASQLIALHRTFDALLAESAAKEAVFYSQLQENLAQPPAKPEPADGGKKSGEAIPWENLIDFSR